MGLVLPWGAWSLMGRRFALTRRRIDVRVRCTVRVCVCVCACVCTDRASAAGLEYDTIRQIRYDTKYDSIRILLESNTIRHILTFSVTCPKTAHRVRRFQSGGTQEGLRTQEGVSGGSQEGLSEDTQRHRRGGAVCE